ncbi:MAG: molybdopterin-guanine dinucleotide biosynthesis protein B, partial [Anaerolineae bacterium]
GYKRGPLPKIEVSRRERSQELLCSEGELFAIVSDQRFPLDVPQFDLDDAAGLADLIEARLLNLTAEDTERTK